MGAKFQKAKPQQARLKVSIYGPPGSGKTFSTLLMAEGLAAKRKKRIAYVDTERGTDFYAQAVKARQVHPDAFDFDAIYTRSLADITEAVNSLDPAVYGVVVLDSMSHLWEAAMEAYSGKKTSRDGIPMHAWGKIKKPYKDLVKNLIASSFDVFILGRQKNTFEDDENGEMKKVGVAMRAEGETAYEPHICIRMQAEVNPDKTTQSAYLAYIEKDRTGVLAGKVLTNPSFKDIEPLLPLLGEVQAAAEDEDERTAKDGELMDRLTDEKARAKEEKSAALFQEYQGRLLGAANLGVLGEAAADLKKQNRYLTDDHATALREMYKSRREKLVADTAPEL